jgi:putative intracellular protease/amidase
MFRHIWLVSMMLLVCGTAWAASALPPVETSKPSAAAKPAGAQDILLPPARTNGQISVEAVLAARGRVDAFDKKQLTLEQMSQLAFAAFGAEPGKSPAGAGNSLDMYFVLDTGVYAYRPAENSLGKISKGDKRTFLAGVVSAIRAVSEAPCSIVLAVKASRLGEASLMAAGRTAGAIDAQALAMGLGTVTCQKIGAAEAADAIGLPSDQVPLCVMAVGYPANGPVIITPLAEGTATKTAMGGKVLAVVPSKAIIDAEYDLVTKAMAGSGYLVVVAGPDTGTFRTIAGKEVNAMVKLSEVDVAQYEGIIFLGGIEVKQYYQDAAARRVVLDMIAAKKAIGAVSSAPRILAGMGVLSGLKVASNTSEKPILLKEGAIVTGADVERDTKNGATIITASGGKQALVKFTQQFVDAMKMANREESPKAGEMPALNTVTPPSTPPVTPPKPIQATPPTPSGAPAKPY